MRMSFISSAFPSAGRSRSARRAGVRQQGHLPRVLDGLGDLALLLHGDTRDAAGTDLAAVGDELAQDVDVLVVDLGDTHGLERVLLLLGLANRWLRHRGAPCTEGARACLIRGPGMVGDRRTAAADADRGQRDGTRIRTAD